jgi:hypothetical protein
MRQLPSRMELPEQASNRLAERTREIVVRAVEDQITCARQVYDSSRTAKWFLDSVVASLKELAGPGERCMYCSGSEASQVEHFRPKRIFPQVAMSWENFLWICGLCNQNKGDQFPPHTRKGHQIINPLEENVWDFYFIDDFGLFCALWDSESNAPNGRAEETQAIAKLNRDALVDSRLARMNGLKQAVSDSLALHKAGKLSKAAISERIDTWLMEPHQLDVADYFLIGPGQEESPFSELLEIVK